MRTIRKSTTFRPRRLIAANLGFVAVAAAAATAGAQQLQYHHTGPAGSYAELGLAVTGLKDVTGDGKGDYAVSAPLNDGYTGFVTIYSGATGNAVRTLIGASGTLYGWAIADAGDVDGDGVHDLIIGAPGDAGLGTDAGSFSIVRGNDGSTMLQVSGAAGDLLGFSVTGLDDIDGDGLDDVVVGAPGYKQGVGRVRAYNRYGAVLWTRTGTQSKAQLGYSVADGGLVNGPFGARDVLAGEPFFDIGADFDIGRAHAFSGDDGATLWTWQGDDGGDWFGTDVDGIGYSTGAPSNHDVLIGAPGNDQNGSNSGFARAYSGLSGSAIFTVRGDDAGDYFGYRVFGFKQDLGDDGYADFAVGAPSEVYDGEPGLVRVYTGGGILVNQYDDPSLDCGPHKFFGAALGSTDFNADGQPDMIIGMPGDWWGCDIRGSAWLYWIFTDDCIDYGPGWPGCSGEPEIKCIDGADIGGRTRLFISNSLRAPTPAILFVGLEPADIKTSAGGHLLVGRILFPLVLALEKDGVTLDGDIPDDERLGGLSLFLQAIEVDPWASQGLSFTPGLELILGWDY